MPLMLKQEYDELISDSYICRIAFKGESHPYIAPFLYIFDGRFMYFLSTKYGKKVGHFRQNPSVTVEVEKYNPNLSDFAFVAIPGRLEEVHDPDIKNSVRASFVELIKKKNLSMNVLSALGTHRMSQSRLFLPKSATMSGSLWELKLLIYPV